MTEKRNVRASEIRESVRDEVSRPQGTWTPPALLDAPEPRPGYVQRWVATAIQGKDTPDNVYKRMREGWETQGNARYCKENSTFLQSIMENGLVA